MTNDKKLEEKILKELKKQQELAKKEARNIGSVEVEIAKPHWADEGLWKTLNNKEKSNLINGKR